MPPFSLSRVSRSLKIQDLPLRNAPNPPLWAPNPAGICAFETSNLVSILGFVVILCFFWEIFWGKERRKCLQLFWGLLRWRNRAMERTRANRGLTSIWTFTISRRLTIISIGLDLGSFTRGLKCMVWSMVMEHTNTPLVECLRWNQRAALALSSDVLCGLALLTCLVQSFGISLNTFPENIMATPTIWLPKIAITSPMMFACVLLESLYLDGWIVLLN